MKTFLINRNDETLAIIRAKDEREVQRKVEKACEYSDWDFRIQNGNTSGFWICAFWYDIKEMKTKMGRLLNYFLDCSSGEMVDEYLTGFKHRKS